MAFANPDCIKKDEKVTQEKALQIYHECFVQDSSGISEKTEEEAFLQSYAQLQDYHDPKNKLYYTKDKKLIEFKKANKGGRFTKHISPTNEEEWEIQPFPTCPDLKTLILNIVLTKLTQKLDLRTELLLSEYGEQIYILVKSDEHLINKWAVHNEIVTELEVGITDLSSLLPANQDLKLYYNLDKSNDIYGIKQKEQDLALFFTLVDDQKKYQEQFQSNTQTQIPNQHLEVYSVYLDELKKLFIPFEKIRVHFQELTGLYLKKVCLIALERANRVAQQKNLERSWMHRNVLKRENVFKLQTLWQRLNIDKPFNPYARFYQSKSGVDRNYSILIRFVIFYRILEEI